MSEHDWFVVYAQGHHGYPQPEESWADQVYPLHCPSCGMHGPQIGDFRFRGSNRAAHSHFRQPNWVFDVWFVPANVEESLLESGLSGFTFRAALDHRSGRPLEHTRQLVVTTTIGGADTSRLPTVTCKRDNEESHLPLARSGGPYCGTVKHHPPTSLVIPAVSLEGAADVVQTADWFGSGASAHQITIASQRFRELVAQQGWRGLEFKPVAHAGKSIRAA